jgi:ATP-dependent DNA helicase DinG
MSQAVHKVFEANGEIAQKLSGFHPRPAQIQMAKITADIMRKGMIGVVEAGTGTGKSLAYLYPAIFLLPPKERLIISTQTIHLQQQIMDKDLPLVLSLFPQPPSVALLLGRGNYPCLRKIHQLTENASTLSPEERSFFDRIRRSRVSNRQEAKFRIDYTLWSQIASEAATCLRSGCPWFSACPWQAARKTAFEANVIIVNHHLYFSDLAIRIKAGWETERAMLPPHNRVVFDEAHHLEEIASNYLGIHWDEQQFTQRFERLMRHDGRRKSGLLPGLRERLLDRAKNLASLGEILSMLTNDVIPAVDRLDYEGKEFFLKVKEHISNDGEQPEGGRSVRYKGHLESFVPSIKSDLDRLIESMDNTEKVISLLVDSLAEDEPGGEDAIFLAETGRELAQLRQEVPLLLQGEEQDSVHWIAVDRERNISLHRVPLEIGPLFHREFLSHVHGAVFTSATLTVGGKFDYFRNNMGIDHVHPVLRQEVALPPAFDYSNQALVLALNDLPEPDRPEFVTEATKLIPMILKETSGRAFILFTNRQQMNDIFEKTAKKLKAEGMTVLCQDQTPRHILIQQFKSAKDPVLFGMDSFWEGVDIQGEQLSCVIMSRLPFRVPSEPVQEARLEALRQAGADGFQTLSLPQAVIRFKQGFGRLIRSKDDHGSVIVLDPRLVRKRYGREFCGSLPGGTIRYVGKDEVVRVIHEWNTSKLPKEHNKHK